MTESDPIPQPDGAPMEIPASARRLLRVVYTMGIVLVLLFVTLIGAIIWKANHKPPPQPAPAVVPLALGLPADTEIRGTSLDGDRLVINTGREVIVVDIRKNAVISRVQAGP